MVVQLTYPVLDARRILNSSRTDLVHAPNWFELWDKDDENAYLKGIGQVVQRPSTGKLKLPMESLCVDALRKLRVGPEFSVEVDGREHRARPLFVRLFWDGYFVCRVDLGFKIVPAPASAHMALLQSLVGSEVGFFGHRADLLSFAPIIEATLNKATDLVGKGEQGIVALKPSVYVQLEYSEVRNSDLIDAADEFMEDSVAGLAKQLRFAPSYRKKFEVTRLASYAQLRMNSSAGKGKYSVWVIPERKVLAKAALDSHAVARHMRITISKLASERTVLEAAATAAKERPELAAAVLQAVDATIQSIEERPLDRPGIATNDASYGAALMTKAFTVERHFATNQYHKLELFRQQTLAHLRQQSNVLTSITTAGDVNIFAMVRSIGRQMNEDKPSVQFGDLHAGRDINSQIGDGNVLQTGASIEQKPFLPEEWTMLASDLPKLRDAMLRDGGTSSETLAMVTNVAKASEAVEKKDEKGVLDSLKAAGGKLLEFAEKVGSAALLAWLKTRFGF